MRHFKKGFDMETRGYIIGYIIDELFKLENKIEVLNKHGLTDLNIHGENFIRDLLNKLLNLNCKNLNEETPNFPGIDLIDEANGQSFQISSTKTSEKINNCIETLNKNKHPKFKKLNFIVLGKKQNSYTGLDTQLTQSINFKIEDIWDFHDIIHKITYLDFDKLKDVYHFFKSQLGRVIVELELPDANGEYETSYITRIQNLTLRLPQTYNSYHEYISKTHNIKEKKEIEKVTEDLNKYIIKLSKSTRLTREFYFIIQSKFDGYVLDSKLKRILSFSDSEFQEELDMLFNDNLAGIAEEEKDHGIKYYISADDKEFFQELSEFSKWKQISLKELIVNANFSHLD